MLLCRVVVLNDYQSIRNAFKEDVFSGRPDLKMLEVRNAGIRKGRKTRNCLAVVFSNLLNCEPNTQV